ncbi:uncharacterized protein Dwil_GK21129 [Drosophila willistoni]|uniref:Uncharacterized protein n=1 Tax=Drosophila willistoni TaxID=7260 RepID=B4N7J7_DROWI|nr:uncharacterized protein Dwil_GK21129 [Drosophila willistoni]
MDNRTANLILDEHRPGQTVDNNAAVAANRTGEATVQLVSNSFVIDIVERINELYHFKNFIFYISERLDLQNENSLDFFREFCIHFPLAPNLIFTRNYHASMPMVELISTPSLVMIYTTERDDPIMELAAQKLRGIRWLKTLFILFPKLSTTEFYVDFDALTQFSKNINNTFDWVWSKQFLNTVLITLQNNVYLLEPYPTPSIVNKTDSWKADEFFYKYSRDMKEYVLKTPILYDLPRVFKSDRPTNSYEDNYEDNGIS